MRPLLIALIGLLFTVLPANAADHLRFSEATLDNGLRVIVASDHTSPVVSHNLLFFAGAADDQLGASGVAHYLEHLMFKGTPTVPEGEFSKRIDRLGGKHNAYTGADMTGYYVTIASKHLEEVMKLEADRMVHYSPSDEAYEKELNVILEERRLRTEIRPVALLSEMLDDMLFPHHPYGRPIIGYMHEMEGLNKAKVDAFFHRHYTPSNAVLILIGDVHLRDALKLAKQHYGSWQGTPKPERSWVNDPPRLGSATTTLRDKRVSAERLIRRYPAPSLGSSSDNPYIMPLIFAEELLGNPRTGYLYDELVRKQQLTTSVSLGYSPFSRGPSTMSVVLYPAEGVSLHELERAYEQAVHAFMDHQVSKSDMMRTRNQLKAATILARDEVQGMAFILAQLVMIGLEPEWFNRWPELVDAVTKEQMKEAVAQTLLNANHVTGYLLPESTDAQGVAHED